MPPDSASGALPILLDILRAEDNVMVKKKSNSKVALAAVKAIQALLHYKDEDMSREVKSTLMSIFRSVAMLYCVFNPLRR